MTAIGSLRSADRLKFREVILFFGSSSAFALTVSVLGWAYLPYERLERFSLAEQFLLWEGAVWLLALLLTFLGVASIIQMVGWRLHEAVASLLRAFRTNHAQDGPLTAAVPLWMITSGLLLMVIGALARVFMA